MNKKPRPVGRPVICVPSVEESSRCLVSFHHGLARTPGHWGVAAPIVRHSRRRPRRTLWAPSQQLGGKKCFSVDESMEQPTPTKKRRNEETKEEERCNQKSIYLQTFGSCRICELDKREMIRQQPRWEMKWGGGNNQHPPYYFPPSFVAPSWISLAIIILFIFFVLFYE